MTTLKEVLIDQLRDLLHAETQLTNALPKMSQAAKNARLKEAFEKHLDQTRVHVERLNRAFEFLGEDAKPKPCRAMIGLIEEGEETIQEAAKMDPVCGDLALIAAAQRVEHYEISAYGTARGLARQIGENECARLLSHTLGDEESTDFLLTSISDPLLQQAALNDMNANVDLNRVRKQERETQSARGRGTSEKVGRGAA
jgi:Mn-containing catalase